MTPTRFAANTSVPVEKSRAEIERLLMRHQCSRFSSGVDHEKHVARIQFEAHKRIIKFEILLPFAADPKYRKDRHGWIRSPSSLQTLVEQEERQRWRALLLVIKAKLEAVELGIATFEDEFMAHILLPNQRTVAEIVSPLIEQAYTTGRLPTALALPEKVDP